MIDSRLKLVASGVVVAIAAGLAAALVFLLAARGSVATMILGYFAPLPIMIAAISFGLSVGAAAAALGASFIALVFHPVLGLLFAAMIGAPAALIAAAAIIAPPRAEGRPRDLAPNFALLSTALVTALTVVGVIALLVWRYGGFDQMVDQAIADAVVIVKDMIGDAQATGKVNAEDLARFFVYAAPIGLSISELVLMSVNLWLAGRIAVISGNLPRPWPPIADDLSIPPAFGALFAAASGLVFIGGLPGAIASVFAAVFGIAFAFQGLAVLHVLTRGSSMRFPLLFATYAIMLLLPPWPFLLLAIVGLVDAAFHLRTRKSASTRPNV
jgi:hypothetical protein